MSECEDCKVAIASGETIERTLYASPEAYWAGCGRHTGVLYRFYYCAACAESVLKAEEAQVRDRADWEPQRSA